MLSVNKIPFDEVRISLSTNKTHLEIAKYSGAGKVPVLHDKNLIIWDSLAICEYISEQYLDGKGWPVDFKMRAEARSCSAEMHSGFFAIREKMPMNCRASNRSVPISNDLRKEILRIDDLWSGLTEKNSKSGPWLFGEFSIADCMFAPVVFRFSTYKVAVSGNSKIYMENVFSNSAIQHWLKQSIKEIETIDIDEAGI